MFIIYHRIDAIAECEGEAKHSKVSKCHSVKLLGSRVFIIFLVVKLKSWNQSKYLIVKVNRNILDLGHFPNLNSQSNNCGDPDDGVGVVVEDVQDNNQVLEYVEEHRSNRQAFYSFPVNWV